MKKNIFVILFSISSLVGFANGGNEGKDGKTGTNSASTAEVSYVSGKDGEYLFNVVYNNTTGSRFSVIVIDADGNQLFQALYNDKKFDKKFKLADPNDFGKLTFVIRNFGDNSVQRFEVNENNKLIEEVQVKEVN